MVDGPWAGWAAALTAAGVAEVDESTGTVSGLVDESGVLGPDNELLKPTAFPELIRASEGTSAPK
jgi:hypothetical protein